MAYFIAGMIDENFGEARGIAKYIGSTGIAKVRYTLKVALRAACNERLFYPICHFICYLYTYFVSFIVMIHVDR
jgi:hypothetical protein